MLALLYLGRAWNEALSCVYGGGQLGTAVGHHAGGIATVLLGGLETAQDYVPDLAGECGSADE